MTLLITTVDNATNKLSIADNLRTFGHNDKKNADNKLIIGRTIMTIGQNDKKSIPLK